MSDEKEKKYTVYEIEKLTKRILRPEFGSSMESMKDPFSDLMTLQAFKQIKCPKCRALVTIVFETLDGTLAK